MVPGPDNRFYLRILSLVLLALIPLGAVVWAILSQEQQAVCGSWWYGLIAPLVIVLGRATDPKED